MLSNRPEMCVVGFDCFVRNALCSLGDHEIFECLFYGQICSCLFHRNFHKKSDRLLSSKIAKNVSGLTFFRGKGKSLENTAFSRDWWRLADSNRRPLACEAGALTSGARRTGRKPCGARLSIAFSTACSLRLSNPERLRPLLLSYRLIMLLSILLDNTEQLQLFSIIFHHPTAT